VTEDSKKYTSTDLYYPCLNASVHCLIIIFLNCYANCMYLLQRICTFMHIIDTDTNCTFCCCFLVMLIFTLYQVTVTYNFLNLFPISVKLSNDNGHVVISDFHMQLKVYISPLKRKFRIEQLMNLTE
jgi:hypothetical protein